MTREQFQAQGGSAFPTSVSADSGGGLNHGDPGMTLRDWFAGQALVAYLAQPVEQRGIEPSYIAADAYAIADAMLEARKGK